MVRSSRRDQKTKAIAEVLAMIADEHLLTPDRRRPALCGEEALHESITEFCAALEFYAARAAHPKKCGAKLQAAKPSRAAHACEDEPYRENFLYLSRCGMTLSIPKRRFLSSS